MPTESKPGMNRQNKLKVLFVTTWYPNENARFQGIFVKEHAIAATLFNEVAVLALSIVDSDYKGDMITEEVDENGITTFRLRQKQIKPSKLGTLLNIVNQYRFCVNLLRNQFMADIIHAHTFHAGVPSVMAGKRLRIPVMMTEHYSGFPKKELTRGETFLARYAMNRAQLVAPVSRNLEKAIREYGIKRPMRVIPCVVDCNTFRYRSSESGMKNDTPRVLMIGSLSPVKGVTYLLKAVALLKGKGCHFKLDIVGDGPSRKELEQEANDLDLDSIVHFHGARPKIELSEMMAMSSFFVLPSLSENFACALNEAMAAGLPVVSTTAGGIPDLVTDEEGILVEPANPVKLAEAIDTMLVNYKRYSPEKISKRIHDRLNCESVGRLLDENYRQVIAQLKQ